MLDLIQNFYTAPIVKFFTHSVTTGIVRWNEIADVYMNDFMQLIANNKNDVFDQVAVTRSDPGLILSETKKINQA